MIWVLQINNKQDIRTFKQTTQKQKNRIDIDNHSYLCLSLIHILLQSIGRKEENKDIKFTQTSSGTIFLYSDKYLDDDLAEFLAEEQEMRPLNP